MRALDQRIDEAVCLGELRCDAAANTRAIAWLMVRYTDWKTLTCRIGWQNLADLAGLSRKTVGRVIRRLTDWGFLGIVETGSTRRTRGCRKGDTDGNRAAEYVLCVPGQKPVEISVPPSLASVRKPEKPFAHARETAHETTDRPWPMHQPPRTRGQRLAATRRLQQQAPLLARLSDRQLRSLLRPWYELGRTPAQVLYALDHRPDGTPHWHTADVRHVAGWLKHRLGLWGRRTPVRQLGAGQSTDLTAVDVAEIAPPGKRSTADVETHASLARRLLAATKRRSDKKPARGLGVLLPNCDGNLKQPDTQPSVGRNPYAADDPRHRYAAAVERDRAMDLAAAAEAVEQHRQPAGMGDGFDWLLQGLARRAEPVSVFGRLGASA